MSYQQQYENHIMISKECNDAKKHVYSTVFNWKKWHVIYFYALQCSNAGEVVVLMNIDEIAINKFMH